MRVRLKTRMAGPSGVAQPGSVVCLPDGQAQLLIDGGFAEAIDGPIEEEVETTEAVPEAERAVSRRGRAKTGGQTRKRGEE